MMIEKVKNTILNNSLMNKGEHIVVGLSGGPDSVCLFHVLCCLKEEWNLTLHAVHVNHQFRPGAAEEDQKYVEQLCEKYGVPCHSYVYDVNRLAKEQGLTGEEAGRQVRYQSFFEIASALKGAKVKIAVAQNLNDQAETVLMRILRGTGTDGLAGIEYKREGLGGIEIIRPLLDVTRHEIEQYCEENHLKPQIDHTNMQPIYTRNKIRLNLIPYLKENYNDNILYALDRLSKIAKDDKDYFQEQCEGIIRQATLLNKNLICIKHELLKELHPAIRNRVVIKLFAEIGLVKDISAIHLEAANSIIREGKTSANIDFPNGYSLSISYDTVEFRKKIETEEGENELNGHIEVTLVDGSHGFSRCINNLQAFDYEALRKTGCEPILRYRKPGDWIRLSGMKGTKKIQDYFVDAKIKKEDRDRIPLVCLGSEVIWIIGFRVSDHYRVKETTQDILLLEYRLKI